MNAWAAMLTVGALFFIGYTLASIDGRLKKIADELMRARKDNSAWRENVLNRDR